MGGTCTSTRSEEALEGDAVYDMSFKRSHISGAVSLSPQHALMYCIEAWVSRGVRSGA